MKILDYSNYEKIFVIGDIHGEFDTLFKRLARGLSAENGRERRCRNSEYVKSIIFVAGDCGFGFNSQIYLNSKLNKINELLKPNETVLIFIRGNHDDPSYFNENKINFSNVKAVKDYTVVLTKNHKTLCVGGSISYDRTWRISQERRVNRFKLESQHKKHLYWEDETFNFDENEIEEIKNSDIKIDSLITHTYPRIGNAIGKDAIHANWAVNDSQLLNDIKKEDENVEKLYNTLKSLNTIEFWASGHIHKFNEYIADSTYFIQLDCAINIYDIQNCMDLAKKSYAESYSSFSVLDSLIYDGLNGTNLVGNYANFRHHDEEMYGDEEMFGDEEEREDDAEEDEETLDEINI